MVKLDLYLAGHSRNSMTALRNLRALLARLGQGGVELSVIDVLDQPERALDDGVLVTPTVIRRDPEPIRIVVGTLEVSDDVRILLQLDDPPS